MSLTARGMHDASEVLDAILYEDLGLSTGINGDSRTYLAIGNDFDGAECYTAADFETSLKGRETEPFSLICSCEFRDDGSDANRDFIESLDGVSNEFADGVRICLEAHRDIEEGKVSDEAGRVLSPSGSLFSISLSASMGESAPDKVIIGIQVAYETGRLEYCESASMPLASIGIDDFGNPQKLKSCIIERLKEEGLLVEDDHPVLSSP